MLKRKKDGTGQSIDASALYVAVDSVAAAVPGNPFGEVVRRGEKVRGDHAVLRAAPGAFVKADSTSEEIAQARNAMHPAPADAVPDPMHAPLGDLTFVRDPRALQPIGLPDTAPPEE